MKLGGCTSSFQTYTLGNPHTSPHPCRLVEFECAFQAFDSNRAEAIANRLRLLLYGCVAGEEHLWVVVARYPQIRVLHSSSPQEAILF